MRTHVLLLGLILNGALVLANENKAGGEKPANAPAPAAAPAANAGPVETGYIADRTCPFVRGSDSVRKVNTALKEALVKLTAQCSGAVNQPLINMQASFDALLTAAGVKQFADPGSPGKGIFGIRVDCNNYQKIFAEEYEYAEESARAKRHSFPSERYKSCFEDTVRADEAKQSSCISRVYANALTDQKHSCLFQEDAAQSDERQKTIATALREVTVSASSIAQGLDKCGADAPRIMDAVLSTVGVIAGTTPGLGIYGAGAAFGADVLRQLVRNLSAAVHENKSFKSAQSQAAIAKLGCLYTEALDKTALCQARQTSAAGRVRAEANAALMALGQQGATDANNFYNGVSAVAKQIENIRSLAVRKKPFDTEIDQLINMLGADDQIPLNQRPVVKVPTANGNQVQIGSPELIFNYLSRSSLELQNFRSQGNGRETFISQDRQIKRQGKQLADALVAILAYSSGPTRGGDKQYQDMLKALQITGADAKDPRFDLMETLQHVMSRTPLLKSLRNADLLKESETPPDFGANHGELVDQFFALTSAMGEEKEKLFSTDMFTAAMKQPMPATELGRLEEFSISVEPLLRHCALLGGVLLYDKSEAGTLKMADRPNLLRRTFTKTNRERYANACKIFQCTATTGLPPFQNYDQVEAFTNQQCQLMKDYDAHRLAFQNNYVHGNRMLCPPANWQPPIVPGDGHAK